MIFGGYPRALNSAIVIPRPTGWASKLTRLCRTSLLWLPCSSLSAGSFGTASSLRAGWSVPLPVHLRGQRAPGSHPSAPSPHVSSATLNKPCVMPDPCKFSFVQNGNEPILTSNSWVTSQLHGPGTIARRLSNQLSTASPLRSAPPKPERQRLPGRGMRVLIPKVSMA